MNRYCCGRINRVDISSHRDGRDDVDVPILRQHKSVAEVAVFATQRKSNEIVRTEFSNNEEYFIIKLSTTEETFVQYRAEFKRFLKNFRIIGY